MFLYTSIFQDGSEGRVVKNSVDTAKHGANIQKKKSSLAPSPCLIS